MGVLLGAAMIVGVSFTIRDAPTAAAAATLSLAAPVQTPAGHASLGEKKGLSCLAEALLHFKMASNIQHFKAH